MLPSEYNEYPCPACEEDVRVPLPASAYVTCPSCQSKLEIHPDAEFEDGLWHDKTHLSVVEQRESVSTDDMYREHIKRMLAKGLDWINDNAGGTSADKT
jgi:DNA-directed RNA polymerase subunit RPC12/RpoP